MSERIGMGWDQGRGMVGSRLELGGNQVGTVCRGLK